MYTVCARCSYMYVYYQEYIRTNVLLILYMYMLCAAVNGLYASTHSNLFFHSANSRHLPLYLWADRCHRRSRSTVNACIPGCLWSHTHQVSPCHHYDLGTWRKSVLHQVAVSCRPNDCQGAADGGAAEIRQLKSHHQQVWLLVLLTSFSSLPLSRYIHPFILHSPSLPPNTHHTTLFVIVRRYPSTKGVSERGWRSRRHLLTWWVLFTTTLLVDWAMAKV